MCYIEDGLGLVESGELWVADKYEEKVVINSWVEFLFRPDGNLNLAILVRAMSEGSAVVEIYSAPDVLDTGPEFTVYNRNQAPLSPLTLGAKIYDAPVLDVGGPGTRLHRFSQGDRNGGEVRDTTAWGLAKDVDYLVRAINTSGAKRDMTLHVDFLEGTI